MDPVIIASIIGAISTVSAAIIGCFQVDTCKRKIHSLEEASFVRFMRGGENLKDILPRVNTICMYTVNSFELLNSLNTTLEQNPNLKIKKMTILVRKKSNESVEDNAVLERIITLWKKWVDEKRIKKLKIIAYDHDPDHYYTIIGDRLVFCGQVMFDETKPTNTNVDYIPLVFTDETNIGQQVIRNYQKHFDNAMQRYKHTGLLFDSESET